MGYKLNLEAQKQYLKQQEVVKLLKQGKVEEARAISDRLDLGDYAFNLLNEKYNPKKQVWGFINRF